LTKHFRLQSQFQRQSELHHLHVDYSVHLLSPLLYAGAIFMQESFPNTLQWFQERRLTLFAIF
jgi:hypothetical protein